MKRGIGSFVWPGLCLALAGSARGADLPCPHQLTTEQLTPGITLQACSLYDGDARYLLSFPGSSAVVAQTQSAATRELATYFCDTLKPAGSWVLPHPGQADIIGASGIDAGVRLPGDAETGQFGKPVRAHIIWRDARSGDGEGIYYFVDRKGAHELLVAPPAVMKRDLETDITRLMALTVRTQADERMLTFSRNLLRHLQDGPPTYCVRREAPGVEPLIRRAASFK